MSTSRGTNATGRSNGQIKYSGAARGWKLDGQFMAHPRSLMESPGWTALNSPSRRVLDALELEHLKHGGMENGRLLLPHLQLRTSGISGRDIAPSLALLEAFGIVRRTDDHGRQGGRPCAATYALTWYPTADGQPPTEDYKRVTAADVERYLSDARTARQLSALRKVEATVAQAA